VEEGAMAVTKLTEINGKDLYYAFLAGSSMVYRNQGIMNRINVFPVPDGDTGSNLASTFRHIVEQTVPDLSFKKTADAIAAAALDGARGNSGIIFAQFLYGLSRKTGQEHKIDVKRFAQIIKSALQYAVLAIEKPVEGTVITVLRDWVNHVQRIEGTIDDFFQLLNESLTKARKSLRETPLKLEILKKHNVVDAGAQGFVYFLEGVMDIIKERDIKKILRYRTVRVEPVVENPSLEESRHRYCTEAIIEGDGVDEQAVRQIAANMGDSLVVAGSGRKLRIHLHTDNPAGFFSLLRKQGSLPFQKVDDMKRQYEVLHRRKWNIALVTDSVCDLPQEIMDRYQIHMVPINIRFDAGNFLDKRSITPRQFYQMLNGESDFPTTSQPGLGDFTALYSHLAAHYDSVIAVHMSKHLSGTWNVSSQAAQKVQVQSGKKIAVIDSRQLSGTLGLTVLRTARAIADGLNHEEIVNRVGEWSDRAFILVSVKTLQYMVRGGRVSPMKGKLANLLNLKPIVSLDAEGKSILYDKAFSQKGNIKKVIKIIQRGMRGHRLWKYSVLHAHEEREAARYAKKLETVLGQKADFIIDISPAVGLSAGHGALAVSIMKE
jgi:DegV family protein with EDD domain